MIFDGNTLDEFQKKYGVRSIETHVEPVAFFDRGPLDTYGYYDDTEVRFIMGGAGFRQLMRDLPQSSGTDTERGYERYFRTTFEVDKLSLEDDTPWVAKFDTSRHDLAAISVLAEKLSSEFPNKQIVFMPKDINIETMGVEGLTALRDYLSNIIESLDYDNIMGF